MLNSMWKRAFAAGLAVGAGMGVGGIVTVQGQPTDAKPVVEAKSYDTAAELIFDMRRNGAACQVTDANSKYPVCQLDGDGSLLTVRSVPGGWFTGGMPLAPSLIGPNWMVSADSSQALDRVQRRIGGELQPT